MLQSEGRSSDSPFVEMVYRTRTEQAGVFMSQAAYLWEMVVTKYEGKTSFTVRGPETKATSADYLPGAEVLGIVFKLGTYLPHLPISKIIDRNDVTLPEATNQSFWLLGSAWQFPSYDNADTFVQRMVRNDLLARDPVVEAVLHGSTQTFSLRTVQRRFLHTTGLTHKTIQQIERARRAVMLLGQGMSILDTAYELAYSDQSHLTNALKRFMGMTPAQVARMGQRGQVINPTLTPSNPPHNP
ncbi:MAG: helix-turn-helix transcriptional regulator [Anaerolineae bacterium]|nr:helix-turn-helix transcriptional regulator [Anaerolineae bacterium]